VGHDGFYLRRGRLLTAAGCGIRHAGGAVKISATPLLHDVRQVRDLGGRSLYGRRRTSVDDSRIPPEKRSIRSASVIS
jgi:hypothetical protein